MAAYLLKKRGGRMAFIKLMKLLYLSDRRALELYGFPISGDRYCSMNKGPVLSQTYSLIKDGSDVPNSPWESWIADAANHEVVLRKHFHSTDDLDELSPVEIEVMDEVFREFGHWKRFELCDETHKICGEWQDPHGSSIPISLQSIFIALGKTPEIAQAMANKIQEQDHMDTLLADLR
ncbi:TPA: SocA family protein [Escherichia coli]|nr:SocA family protein [Escherichia coli]